MLFTTATFDNDVCAQGREVPHVKGLWYLGDVFCDADAALGSHAFVYISMGENLHLQQGKNTQRTL